MALLRDDPGLWLLLHLRPPGDRRHDAHGRCAVCGAVGRQVRNGWVLSGDLRRRYGAALADRETLFCEHCGCSLRVRRIAEVLVEPLRHRCRDPRRAGARGRLPCAPDRRDQQRRADAPDPGGGARSRPCRVPGGGHPGAQLGRRVVRPRADLGDPRARPRPAPRASGDAPRAAPGWTPRLHRPRRALARRHAVAGGAPTEHHGRGGGPFALVTRRADMLVHTDFGGDLVDVVRAEGFDVATDGEGIELVVVATRPEA